MNEVRHCERPKCLVEGCDEPKKCRGLCAACYSIARLRVNSGLVTWSDLVSMGLALEVEERPRNPFASALEEKLESKKQMNGAMDDVVADAMQQPAPDAP